jgi:hypothetical protein
VGENNKHFKECACGAWRVVCARAPSQPVERIPSRHVCKRATHAGALTEAAVAKVHSRHCCIASSGGGLRRRRQQRARKHGRCDGLAAAGGELPRGRGDSAAAMPAREWHVWCGGHCVARSMRTLPLHNHHRRVCPIARMRRGDARARVAAQRLHLAKGTRVRSRADSTHLGDAQHTARGLAPTPCSWCCWCWCWCWTAAGRGGLLVLLVAGLYAPLNAARLLLVACSSAMVCELKAVRAKRWKRVGNSCARVTCTAG